MTTRSNPSTKSDDPAAQNAGVPRNGEVESATRSEDRWFKLKAFGVVEVVVFMIALVLPITPSKTGRPFKWPASWGDYFQDVAFSFALGNIVLLLILIVSWVYVRHLKKRPISGIRDS